MDISEFLNSHKGISSQCRNYYAVIQEERNQLLYSV